MALLEFEPDTTLHPVDIIEHIAAINDWNFERQDTDEISISVRGSWSDYHVSFNWMQDLESLHIACAFDLKVPEARRAEVKSLIAMVNEQLWIGHFDLWSSNGLLLFRHGSLLPPNGLLGVDQAQTIIDVALDECERFYPVFQFIIWGGKSPEEAISAALVETHGEA